MLSNALFSLRSVRELKTFSLFILALRTYTLVRTPYDVNLHTNYFPANHILT